jgi:serine/threonine-protein kinase
VTDEDAPTEAGSQHRTGPVIRLAPSTDDRYDVGPVIGRGGMGEVRLARDVRIERDVAVKLMRPEQRDEGSIARFFREAQVQGRLDHPAVVPVHDLGVDRDGNPYFVMKRLTGTTLAQVIEAGGGVASARRIDVATTLSQPAEPSSPWTRRQLLSRFVDVCLAVEFAHTRGIVHRDLKPANIMLGDFGEVYVLDWGLARILDEARPSMQSAAGSGDSAPGRTIAGELLGTPGYMAPEQIRGERVETRTDVYALGCILYEILVGEAALPRGLAAIDVALSAAFLRPSTRFPDAPIPVELDDICASATAARAEARPTARGLGEAVQAYLDGDRDVERRRALAADHATRAHEALLAGGGDATRASAMREAGRALVLDANNVEAQAVLAHLLLETPDAIPAEARADAERDRSLMRQAALKWVSLAYSGVVVLELVLFLLPIHYLPPLITLVGFSAACAGTLAVAGQRALPLRHPLYVCAVWFNCAALASGSVIFGPLLIVPIFLIGSLAAALSQPIGYHAVSVLAPHVASVGLPLALEWFHVLPSTYRVENHTLVNAPWVVDLTPTLTIIIVLLGVISQSVVTVVLMMSDRKIQERAQDRIHAQSWHLRQLLPKRATDQSAPATADPDQRRVRPSK